MKTDAKLLAVLRIRGEVGISPQIRDCLNLMKLHRKNRTILVENTESMRGMINKVKDYCTFGEINAETVKLLLEKRGRTPGNKLVTAEYLKKNAKTDFDKFSKALVEGKAKVGDVPGLKKFFKLHPPLGGFERVGIKKSFSVGGALGYRGEKINDMIKRMV
tara:strand:- start:499 stop:981 length:483 start_codon:yes stop_codon:yes gene_type:complete